MASAGLFRDPRAGFHVFRLLGAVCGQQLVVMDSEPYLPGMAVLEKLSDGGRTHRRAWAFVVNKSAAGSRLELSIDGWE